MKKALPNNHLITPSGSETATPYKYEGPTPRAVPHYFRSPDNLDILLELLALPEYDRSAAHEFVNKHGPLDLMHWHYKIEDGKLSFRRGAFQALGLSDTPSVLSDEKDRLETHNREVHSNAAAEPAKLITMVEKSEPDTPDPEEFLETYFPVRLPKERRRKAGAEGVVHDLKAASCIPADREPFGLFVREVRRLRSLVDLYSAIQQREKTVLFDAYVKAQALACSRPTRGRGWREGFKHYEVDDLVTGGKSKLAWWLNFFLEDIPIAHNKDLTRSRSRHAPISLLEELYAVFSDLVAEGREIRRCASSPCRGYFIKRLPTQSYCQDKCSTRERVRRHRQENGKQSKKHKG